MTDVAEEEIVLTFLHTADWHLGRRFARFGEDAQKALSRARLQAVDRILRVAEHRGVQAVLCAGDLFDDPLPERSWWEGLAELFQKRSWQERPVFLLPGNHDPLTSDSIWRKPQFRESLPGYVQVVDREDFSASLPGGAVLYAVPCMSRAGQADPTLKIPERPVGDTRIRIGMVHGSTHDAPGYQTNFPIHVDAALQRGLDYLAIGDTHGFRYVPPERKRPPTIYPGTPEPTAFDEREPGQVAVVLMTRQREARVKLERVAQWIWEECRVRSLSELRVLVARTDLQQRVLRLNLELQLPAPEYEEAERLLEDLEGTDARRGKVGILERAGQLELDAGSIDSYCEGLPPVLKATVARLLLLTAEPESRSAAQRALYHLYRLSRKAS